SRVHPDSINGRPPTGSGMGHGPLQVGEGLKIPLEEIGTTDPAHVVDRTVAGVLAFELGATREAVTSVITAFTPGPHRRIVIGRVNGVDYVDDSKATNPHAALAAVAAYPSVVLIAGGLAKGLDLAPLARAENVKAVVAIGTAGPLLAEEAGARGRLAQPLHEADGTAA